MGRTVEFTIKKWNKSNIKELLEKNNTMVERSVVKMYERQTLDEKQIKSANHNNKVGFSGCDAEILSSFAEQLVAGRHLSNKQMEIARKKMMKYSGQLADISNKIEEEKGI